MPDTHAARCCVLCGAPLPPRAKAYCAACAMKRAKQRDAQSYARRQQKKRAARAAMRNKPASAAGGWTDADLVRCEGCKYWRSLTAYYNACHYAIDTGRLRLIRPLDCYGRARTPYTPER